MSYKDIAKEVAELVEIKQEAYGESFHKCHIILSQLFPNGVKVEQYSDLLAIVRVVDKLFRVAANGGKVDPLGENPWKDVIGYGLLSCAKGEE